MSPVSFVQFARTHGVDVVDLCPSDHIQRCATLDHPRSKNGAYFWDGARGWVFNWSGEAKVQWFDDPKAQPWTAADKRAWAEKRMALEVERQHRQARAAQRAEIMLRSAVPGPHDYLIRKGLSDLKGLVLPDGELMVPMRAQVCNGLQGAQVITWIPEERRWDKKMLPGMKAKGAVFRLGKPGSEAILCEGYATGLSIHLAARSVGWNAAVLVCFSAANLVHVAPALKGRCFVFADNDKSGAGERAALATGLPYCMSDVVGEDANDLHVRVGLLAVAAKLMTVRREAIPTG